MSIFNPGLVLFDSGKKERSVAAQTCSDCGDYVDIFAYDEAAGDDEQICENCQRLLGE